MTEDFWGQDTKKKQAEYNRDIEIEKAKNAHAIELAKITAQQVDPERQALLVKTRSENFDTELTLIAEANKPQLEKLALIDRRNTMIMRMSFVIIILGFIAILIKL